MTDDQGHEDEIAKLRAEVEALKAAPPPATVASPAPPKPSGLGRGCLLILAIIGGLFVLLVVIGMIAGGKGSQGTATQTPGIAPEAQAYGVGDQVAAGALKARITGVQIASRIGGYVPTEASEGGQLVIVRYSLTNDTDKPVKSYAAPKVTLLDAKGTVYEEDAGKTGAYEMEHATDTKLWSDINPGITTHGAAVFEVSAAGFNRTQWLIRIGDDDGARVAFPPADVP